MRFMQPPFEPNKIYTVSLGGIPRETEALIRRTIERHFLDRLDSTTANLWMASFPHYPRHTERSKKTNEIEVIFEWLDVTGKGRFLTRLRNWYWKRHKLKIDDDLWNKLSEAYGKAKVVSDTFHFEFSDRVLTEKARYFYHSDSCWFTNDRWRRALLSLGGYGMRFFTTPEPNAETYKNGSSGRAWLLPIENGYTYFNIYGRPEATTLGQILKTFLQQQTDQEYQLAQANTYITSMSLNYNQVNTITVGAPVLWEKGSKPQDKVGRLKVVEPHKDAIAGGYWLLYQDADFLRAIDLDAKRDRTTTMDGYDYNGNGNNGTKTNLPYHIYFKTSPSELVYAIVYTGRLAAAWRDVAVKGKQMWQEAIRGKANIGHWQTSAGRVRREERMFLLVDAWMKGERIPRRFRMLLEEAANV